MRRFVTRDRTTGWGNKSRGGFLSLWAGSSMAMLRVVLQASSSSVFLLFTALSNIIQFLYHSSFSFLRSSNIMRVSSLAETSEAPFSNSFASTILAIFLAASTVAPDFRQLTTIFSGTNSSLEPSLLTTVIARVDHRYITDQDGAKKL